MGDRPRLEVLYFDGCPSYDRVLPEVGSLAAQAGAGLELRRVETRQEAEGQRFLGSPTVRADGVDVDRGAAERDDYGLKCRIYRCDGWQSPSPPGHSDPHGATRHGGDLTMPAPIDYPRLRALLDDGAQLVEVLPEAEYREEHLPGAINMPLKTLDGQSASQLDKTKAIVVYCSDAL